MVPFCELFNHECIDVYYDFTYKPENPHKKEESEVFYNNNTNSILNQFKLRNKTKKISPLQRELMGVKMMKAIQNLI